jgi:hypothetical protein
MCKIGFFTDEEKLKQLDGAIIWLPEGIVGKASVFNAYGAGLSAPNGYFGENWDAFSDCLLDLDWIKARDVYIIHRELPHLSKDDMAIYMGVLRHVVMTWADDETDERHRLYPSFVPRRLTIFFPREVEGVVSSYLKAAIS